MRDKFGPAASRLRASGVTTSDVPLLWGVDFAADATGDAVSLEPFYVRFTNTPLAAQCNPRACFLLALIDYPIVPADMGADAAALFRMQCTQAAVKVALIDSLQVWLSWLILETLPLMRPPLPAPHVGWVGW
jgi:hypothetical protein